jgi:hypothetical protein
MIAAHDRVIFGGPLLDDASGRAVGSVMALELPDRVTLREFLAAEPYNQVGLFGSLLVHEMRQMSHEPTPGLLQAELVSELARANGTG